MRELKIKTESKPKRCEICHQSDLFDNVKLTCLRCDFISNQTTQNIGNENRSFSLTKFETVCVLWLVFGFPFFLLVPLAQVIAIFIGIYDPTLDDRMPIEEWPSYWLRMDLIIGFSSLISFIVFRQVSKNVRMKYYLKLMFE